MTSSGFGSEDPDGDAGEYVIGTLPHEERTAFAARLRDDAAARRAVAAWERRFASLGFVTDAVSPQPETWSRIERELRLADGKLQRFRVIEGGGKRLPAANYMASRNRWRVAALASGAVAAALLCFVIARDNGLLRPTAHHTFVAAINRGGDQPALIIRVDLDSKQVFVRPVAAAAPAGHSLELWYIADGKAPHSMGVVKSAPESVPIPANATPGKNTTFAVTVEPVGGSATGGPTGPVVYSGTLVAD